MRRNLQTGEPELVPRQPGEARLQSGPSADLYSPNTAAGIREAADRGLFGTHPDRMRWPEAAAQIALLAAGGPIATKVGQGATLAYGAAKPVVQGVARRVGGAMKSAPFDPVRRKVLQGIGAGTAALATAGTGLFQGLGGPTATKAVTKAATPLLNKYNAAMKDPWFSSVWTVQCQGINSYASKPVSR